MRPVDISPICSLVWSDCRCCCCCCCISACDVCNSNNIIAIVRMTVVRMRPFLQYRVALTAVQTNKSLVFRQKSAKKWTQSEC